MPQAKNCEISSCDMIQPNKGANGQISSWPNWNTVWYLSRISIKDRPFKHFTIFLVSVYVNFILN